jgi:hypothetical protein
MAPAWSAPRKRRYRSSDAHFRFAFGCQFAPYNPLESLNPTRPNGSQTGPNWVPSRSADTACVGSPAGARAGTIWTPFADTLCDAAKARDARNAGLMKAEWVRPACRSKPQCSGPFRCQFAAHKPLKTHDTTRPFGSQAVPIWDPEPTPFGWCAARRAHGIGGSGRFARTGV